MNNFLKILLSISLQNVVFILLLYFAVSFGNLEFFNPFELEINISPLKRVKIAILIPAYLTFSYLLWKMYYLLKDYSEKLKNKL